MSEEPDRIDMPLDEPAPPEFVELQGGWFLVPPEALPEEWRERATPVYMIRLDGDELQGFALPANELQKRLDREEKEIARLLARGLPPGEIALTLHLSRRSVFRRLARLRQLMGAKTNGELATKLARKDI